MATRFAILVHLVLFPPKSIREHAHVAQKDLSQRMLLVMLFELAHRFVVLVHQEAFTLALEVVSQSVSFAMLEHTKASLD